MRKTNNVIKIKDFKVDKGLPFDQEYNFAYLDENTKKMIRRAIIKALCIPGYQVPFASREMPMPYGWGTGGVQVTASCLTKRDTLKIIDQGADDTTNAVSIRNFFKKTSNIKTTEITEKATLIQTRHRIPETPLKKKQIFKYLQIFITLNNAQLSLSMLIYCRYQHSFVGKQIY